MNSAWIVKYSGTDKFHQPWTSHDIALRFLESSVANTDHLRAYSKNRNHDDITNYVAMHKRCNTQKQDKTLNEWFEHEKDEKIKNLKKYFTEVENCIDSGEIDNPMYKDYVAKATDTIYTATNGEVNLLKEMYIDELKSKGEIMQ